MLTWHTPRGRDLRYCVKVALAAVAAYALTLGERNDYAVYSVLGAALVVGGSVGEDLQVSFNRVRGTLLGAAVGAVLAYALGKSIGSLGLAVAILAWLCVGLGWGTAALRVGIAMALVVLFSQPHDAADYGGWQVVNGLIGVCIGVAVSRLVWPVRGREEVARAIDRTLDATSATLDALARAASHDLLRPLQREVLEALSAIGTARTNARLAQQLDPGADLLSEQTVRAVRAAIDTLGASLRIDELTQSGANAECMLAVRSVIGPLAMHARKARTGVPLSDEFAARHALATRTIDSADIDAGTRLLLNVVLDELEHVRAALYDLRI